MSMLFRRFGAWSLEKQIVRRHMATAPEKGAGFSIELGGPSISRPAPGFIDAKSMYKALLGLTAVQWGLLFVADWKHHERAYARNEALRTEMREMGAVLRTEMQIESMNLNNRLDGLMVPIARHCTGSVTSADKGVVHTYF